MALTKVPSNLDATIATTQSQADNSTNIATTAYVDLAISNLSDSAPAALNTLNEIAAALGDDANYASTTTAAIAGKLPLAGGTMTGNLTVNAIVDADNYTINSAQGTDGQVLTSTGTGVAWESIPAGGVDGIVSSANATAITIDSSENVTFTNNVGVGNSVPYSSWAGDVIQVGTKSFFGQLDVNTATYVNNNLAYDGTNWKYVTTGVGSLYAQDWSANGAHVWYQAASGTAGNNVTLLERMRIDSSGNVGIGGDPDSSGRLLVQNGGTNQIVLTNNDSATTNLNMGNFSGGGYISQNYYYNSGHQADDNTKGAFEIFIGDDSYAINYHSAGAMGTRRRDFAITGAGNVGIGTDSPLVKLDVLGSPSAPATSGTAQTGSLRVSQTAGNGVLDMGFYTSATGTAWIQSTNKANLATNYGLTLQPNGGNVGIGTDSPNTALHVKKLDTSSNRTAPINVMTIEAESNSLPYSGFGGSLVFKNRAYNSGVVESAAITSIINNSSLNSYGGSLAFSTTNTVSGSLIERARVDYNGNVGIGTSSPAVMLHVRSATSGGAKLRLDINGVGSDVWDLYSTSAGRLYVNAPAYGGGVYIQHSATSWTGNSDETLKENITSLGTVGDKLKNYRTSYFNWINDQRETPKRQIGFIAQDWETDFPEVVNKVEGEPLGMQYTETIPILLKYIQELEARITTLENA